MPSLFSFLVPVGIIQFAAASIVFAVFPFTKNPGVVHILVAFGSGILNSCAFMIFLNILRKGEVSRVIPVISTAPIFVALLSMPLLGATLSYLGWLAVVFTVIGAVLISLRREHGGQKHRLQKSFFMLLLVALFGATSSIGYKYAMGTMSFWNIYSIAGICSAVVVLSYSVRKTTLLELKNLKQRTGTLGIIVVEESIVASSSILAFKAVGSGPVSLVNAILNTRSAFVFLFTLVLSRFFPKFINEPLNKSTIFLKLIAIAMMTGGVIIITFSS